MFRNRVFYSSFFLLLLAAGMVTGCSDNTRMAERAIQGRIDSAVRSRLEIERLQLETRNDSLIVAEARRRADSLRAAGELPY